MSKHLTNNPIGALYSPGVLVGEWYQERFSGLNHDDHAITPGIYGQSRCVEEKTTYKSDFIQPIAKNDPQGADDFIDVMIMRLRNKMKNIETNIQQNNKIFMNNMTSMSDLQFRILPETLRVSSKANIFAETTSRKASLCDDLTRCYGNQTNYGLLNAKRCKQLQELSRYHDLSEMKNNYGPKILKPLSPKKPKCKESIL